MIGGELEWAHACWSGCKSAPLVEATNCAPALTIFLIRNDHISIFFFFLSQVSLD